MKKSLIYIAERLRSAKKYVTQKPAMSIGVVILLLMLVGTANIVHGQTGNNVLDVGLSVVTGGTAGKVIGFAAGSILSPILSWIANFIMKLMAFLVYIGGLLLDTAVFITIIKMSQNISSMTGINVAWKVIRDLMNIAFIFLLVYKAILIIIAQNSWGDIKKFITGIVMASILINFSLFFTKIMIDASNVVTTSVYHGMIGEQDAGLSGALMQHLGLQGVFSFDSIDIKNVSDDYGFLVSNIMSAILFLITSFVFFAVSVMLIVRYIVLIVLLATSPIAYMGLAFDDIKAKANEWWKTLSGQLIFAPLFMLMMWVILTLIASPEFIKGSADISQLQGKTVANVAGSSIELIFNFAIIIGLTITALVTSKNYATQGAAAVKDLMTKGMTFAGGALMGGAAAIGRNTIGRGASKIADNEDLQRSAEMGNKAARLGLWAANKTAKGSMDIRRSYAGEQVASATGVNFGKGMPFMEKAGEGGFAAKNKTKEDARRKEIDTVVRRDRSDPAKLAEYILNSKRLTDSDKEYIYDKLSARDRAALDEKLVALGGGRALSAKLRSGLSTEEREKTEKAAGEARNAAETKKRVGNANQLANHFTGKIDPTTGAVYTAPVDPVTGTAYTYKDLIGPKFPPNETRKLSHEARMSPDVIELLSPRHLADLLESGTMTNEEKRVIYEAITGPNYALQAKQTAYINTAKELWTIDDSVT